ncbi:MAG TPA: dockerin type I repeat-containing protein [Pirellulales bacterium]|jgi:hypothetical protein
MSHLRISRVVSAISWQACFAGAAAFIFALVFARAGLAQNLNLADTMGGFELGDFETVSTLNGGVGQQGGTIFDGPAGSPQGLDPNGDPTGVWGDSGDIQQGSYSGQLFQLDQTTVGATHGSKAVKISQLPGGSADGTTSSFNGVLHNLNGGAATQAINALLHASALKLDVTIDRSQLKNPVFTLNQDGSIATGNPFAAWVMTINTPGAGYVQGHASYDSLSVQPATSPTLALGRIGSFMPITSQPNNEAGEYHYADTSTFPGTAPAATSLSQTPTVSGTGSVTMTLTLDFTTNRRNGAGATGDGNSLDAPTWLTFHDHMVAGYSTVDPASMTGQTYGQEGSFYNIYQFFFSLGSFGGGAVTVDNIRLIELGDFNQDGQVNASDVAACEAALTNPSTYEAARKMTPYDMKVLGDVNGDGVFNNADLQALLTGLKNGTFQTVPEPTSILLLGLGGAFLLAQRKRWRNQ